MNTRILWDWNDRVTHTTTSDGGLWNSNLRTGPDATFSFTFTSAGTFPYHCQVHGGPGGVGMSGRIVVVP